MLIASVKLTNALINQQMKRNKNKNKNKNKK